MAKLVYTREELLASHPYAEYHMAAGHKLHGGFDRRGKLCAATVAASHSGH